MSSRSSVGPSGAGSFCRYRALLGAVSCLMVLAPATVLGLPPFSASWIAADGGPNNNFASDVNTAGDVNGDGYSDVLISCPGFNGDLGAAFVYCGSETGLSSTACWSSLGTQDGRQYSNDSFPAGDVNGDGYADVIVAARGYDYLGASNTLEGLVEVFYGSPAGLSATADWQVQGEIEDLELGTYVSTAGDVNGDGYDDVLISALEGSSQVRLFLGSASGLESDYSWSTLNRGTVTAAVGDVNADGYEDFAVSRLGNVYLFLGSSTGPSSTPDWTGSENSTTYYGRTISAAGDVNGDGYADFVAGAPQWGSNETGRVFLYYGGPTGVDFGVDFAPNILPLEAQFGYDVQCAGDVNADGYSDLIVGAHYFDGAEPKQGRVYLYLGDSSGLDTDFVWAFDGDTSNGFLGRAVSGAGDVNGDGYSDLLVGAPSGTHTEFHEGVAYAFYCMGGGLSEDAVAIRVIGQDDAEMGAMVAHAGDLNGDGLGDVVGGAPFFDWTQPNSGTVQVWHGTTSDGDLIDYVSQKYGTEENEFFGFSADGAGDVNGDGYDDLLIGSVFRDGTLADAGAAFLYYGSETGIPTNPGWTSEGEAENAYHGFSVAGAGDVNGDGFADAMIGALAYTNTIANQGAAYLYYGSETGLSPGYDWKVEGGTETELLGQVATGVGDLNGDGFGDVAVGVPNYDGDFEDEGAVFVYYGSASGPATTPDWILLGRQEGCGMFDACAAGDVNGDGYGDLLVATAFYDAISSQEGRVECFFGSAAGLGSSPDWVIYGENEFGGWLGRSISCAGDVNRDGYSDIVIGEENYDGTYLFEGAAYIYHGGPLGLSFGSLHTGGQEDSGFGGSCSTAGDLNGDGFGDVLVGAPDFDAGSIDEGGMFVFLGNDQARRGGLDIRPQQRNMAGVRVGLLGRSDGLQFRIGTNGRSPMGRERVRAEWQVAEYGVALESQAIGIGDWADTGAPTSGPGSVVAIEEDVIGMTEGNLYHWRVRTRTHSLYAPFTRWTSIAPTVGTMAHIRAGDASSSAESLPVGPVHSFIESVAPNPMVAGSSISFQTRIPGPVRVTVHDVNGRRVASLMQGTLLPGSHSTTWDGRTRAGERVANGLYLVRVQTPEGSDSRKVWVTR